MVDLYRGDIQVQKNIFSNQELLSEIEKTYHSAVDGAKNKAAAIQQSLIQSVQNDLEANLEKIMEILQGILDDPEKLNGVIKDEIQGRYF